MNLSTFSKPQLRIGDSRIDTFDSIAILNPGGNQINSINVTGLPKALGNYKLINQDIVLYLNQGSYDSVPIFRGIIKSLTPGDDSVSLKGMDPRIIISGKDAFPIIVDEYENFDGMTLVQFIHTYITKHINTEKELIGLDMLEETTPPLLMRGFRTDLAVPYQIMTDALKQAIDSSDIENPIDYEFVIVDDGQKANLTIQKKQLLENTNPVVRYDLHDGVQNITYNQRNAPPTYALIKGEESAYDTKVIQSRFTYGNMSTGKSGITVTGPYTDRDTAKKAGIIEIMREQDQIKSITLDVSKGYHVGVGSLINLYINTNRMDSYDISGNHRVTSKTISYTRDGGCSMNITLNRKPIRVSDFLH